MIKGPAAGSPVLSNVKTIALLAVLIVALVGGSQLFGSPVEDGPRSFDIGAVSDATPTADCLDGYSCDHVTIRCPGIEAPAAATVGVRQPSAAGKGMVAFFIGGRGVDWYSADGGRPASQLMSELAASGYYVVEVKWDQDSPWLAASDGEDAGPARLACRPATLIDWIRDHEYLPLEIPDRPVGECGFCVSGNSAGASQVGYGLSHYGLEDLLDAVVLSGGPPHASQDKGCLARPEEGEFHYWPNHRRLIDSSYGFLHGGGPCETSDADFLTRWSSEGINTGGSDYVHPQTRVEFLFGSDDDTPAVALGLDYYARLSDAATPYVSSRTVRGAGQGMQDTSAGAEALYAAITAEPAGDSSLRG